MKDENVQLAKSRVASLFLDRGVPLATASSATDALVPALGATACLQAMSLPSTQERWKQLSQTAQAVGQDNRTERAANRIQAAVRRRRLTKAQHIQASDFRLEEGTWCGMDESPVPVLSQLQAGCTGAILIDPAEANSHDLDLLRNMGSDALCVVIPGHTCPDEASCGGRVSVPVQHVATGHRHLLAARYHNVGDTEIHPAFSMARRLLWTAPSVVHLQCTRMTFLRASCGVMRCKLQSVQWCSSFVPRASSRPYHIPGFQFFAKVAQVDLQAVLQHRGFNHVFVVPRTWDHKLLPGWSVVWLPGSRMSWRNRRLLSLNSTDSFAAATSPVFGLLPTPLPGFLRSCAQVLRPQLRLR